MPLVLITDMDEAMVLWRNGFLVTDTCSTWTPYNGYVECWIGGIGIGDTFLTDEAAVQSYAWVHNHRHAYVNLED